MRRSASDATNHNKDYQVHYLILSSEPADNQTSGRITFYYHNRYLAKRRMMRHLRRLRKDMLRE